jgi:hypothetical protein
VSAVASEGDEITGNEAAALSEERSLMAANLLFATSNETAINLFYKTGG